MLLLLAAPLRAAERSTNAEMTSIFDAEQKDRDKGLGGTDWAVARRRNSGAPPPITDRQPVPA